MIGAQDVGLATLGLVAVPAAGALLVRIGPRRGGWQLGVTLAALASLVTALLVVGFAVADQPSNRLAVAIGPEMIDAAIASILCTLAPLVLSLGFVVIALVSRGRVLVGLALLQLALVLPAVLRDLGEPADGVVRAPAVVLDPLAVSLLAVSVLVGGLVVVFAIGYEPIHLRHGGQDDRRTNSFLAWLLLFLGAMHLLVLADDLRFLAVGWELTTLCSFVLIGFDRDDQARHAARRALAYNLFGGAVLAAGLWLAGSGATLTDVLAQPATAGLTAILLLLAVAAATKSALAPFHPWLLGAMVAAAPVSALLHASTMVKAGSYLLLRLSPAFATSGIGLLVTILGAISFAGAAFLALRERDLKRVLALSTVASLGMIAVAAGLGSALALAAGVVFLLLHAAAKGLAFLVVGATEQVTGTRDLEALVGLGRARPGLAGPLVLAAAAMALPPFGIAVAKWALLLDSGSQPVILPMLAAGAAANVALWTAVAGRILVRRDTRFPAEGRLALLERTPIALLAVASGAGLIAAAPLAALAGDPAAAAAFGAAAPLADGWAVAAAGGLFPVLPLAAVTVAVLVGGAAYASRQAVRPTPYLSGLNVGGGASAAFSGPRGSTELAASGGFYWGGALGDGSTPSRLRRGVEAAGWCAIGAMVAVGLVGLAVEVIGVR
jgi:ech hydrogenase subunit A